MAEVTAPARAARHAGRSRSGRLSATGLAAALALLGGCTDQEKLREAELTKLLLALPGTYDNTAQADRDAQSGTRPPHERITLIVMRVYVPRLGHHVQYLQEMAANDPLRVMSERMSSFTVDEKRGIVQTLYTFVDPVRWRDGLQTPEMFTGVLQDDVHSFCELLWKKDGEQQFAGGPDPAHCHPVPPAAPADFAALLSADSLILGTYQFRKTRQ
jgi:CpeT/CpcT family protein DUF1001